MKKKAFTIVEFMLATAVLAVMMMSIATLTIRIIDIYKKGLAMRAVNSVGRDIINDLNRVVTSSPVTGKVMPDASGSVTNSQIQKMWANYYNELTMSKNGKNVQASGVFCTGQYSYIWNTAPVIEILERGGALPASTLKINDKVYRLARIPDSDRDVCEHGSGTALTKRNFVAEASDIDVLIDKDENDLVLYDFSVLPATQNQRTGQIFYSGTFILATLAGGVNVQSTGNYCTGEDDTYGLEANIEATDIQFSYCSVNKFNFAIRATGRSADK